MKRILFMACVLLAAITNMYGQLTTEYFFDTDPGYGKATQNTAKVGDNTITLHTSQLDAGMHLLGIRSTDTSGQWSPTLTSPVYVFAPMADVASAEWFVDIDPGYGKGTGVNMSAGNNVLTISTKGMTTGMHLLGVRSCSKSGQWSPTITSTLYIAEPLDVAKAEWFVDTDPGEGRANSIDINGNNETVFTVPTASLTAGSHSLTVRIMTAAGHWLPYTVTPFDVTIKSGIAEVKNVMTVGIRRMADKITLTCGERMDNAHAEIFTVDGVKRGSNTWPAGEQTLSLDVPQQLSPVIVVVKKMDGTRFVKLVK